MGTRSQYTWPFTWDSIWNMPVSANALYAPTGIIVNSDYSTNATAVEYCCTDPAQPVVSLTNAKLANGSTGAASIYCYPSMTGAGQFNECSAFLGTDGDSVYQGQTLQLTAGGNPTFGGAANFTVLPVSIKTSTGIPGSHGGSGLSALGGTLTKADLTGAGPIQHAMKLLFNGLLYYSSAGAGFTWPATNADGGYNQPGALNFYGGNNPHIVPGALLALPPNIRPQKYADPLVQRIATAMLCYGAYIVDNTASGAGVSNAVIEMNYDAVSSFTGTSTFSSDFHQLLMDLRVITNSAQTTPGGGAIGSARLAPYAPAFSDGTGAPPPVTVVSPGGGNGVRVKMGDYPFTIPPANPAGPAGGVLAGNYPNPVFASAPLLLQAATPGAGFALQNGTPNILTWTAPSDGQMHPVMIIADQFVTTAETGGAVGVFYTDPGGNTNGPNIFAGGSGPGPSAANTAYLIGSGTTFFFKQNSALTAGAATVWAQLWAA